MKETGTHRAVDFYNRGDPGGVADRSLGRKLAEVLAKATSNFPKFSGWFDDVFVIDAGFVLENQPFDLFFECSYLFEIQTYFALFFTRPNEWAVERFRGKVGCEEGDGVKAEGPCCIDCLTQITVVGLLDGRAASDRHARVVVADGADTFMDKVVRSAYAADRVVNLRRAIEGDDDIVEEGGNLFCALVQEKACR